MSLVQKQISRAKHEAEASLANARTLRDQWAAAVGPNPTNLTQKEIEQLGKALKNRLLSVKWDCEDLEELLAGSGETVGLKRATGKAGGELAEAGAFIASARTELAILVAQLEDFELGKRIYNKHGIASEAIRRPAEAPTQPAASPPSGAANNGRPQTPTKTAPTTIINNPLHGGLQYERLLADSSGPAAADPSGDQLHFDKSQLETAAAAANTTIFSNALYEHYEADDQLIKSLTGARVFNNLTRPSADADVFAGANENEMILEMLETEYYNPPAGLLVKTKYNTAIRRLFDGDRRRFLGTVAFVLSLPFLLVLLALM